MCQTLVAEVQQALCTVICCRSATVKTFIDTFYNSTTATGTEVPGEQHHCPHIWAVVLFLWLRFGSGLAVLSSVLLLPLMAQVPLQCPQFFVTGLLFQRGFSSVAFTAYSSRHLDMALPFDELIGFAKDEMRPDSSTTVLSRSVAYVRCDSCLVPAGR